MWNGWLAGLLPEQWPERWEQFEAVRRIREVHDAIHPLDRRSTLHDARHATHATATRPVASVLREVQFNDDVSPLVGGTWEGLLEDAEEAMNARKNHKCPGCNAEGKAERVNFVWVMRCTGCGGVFTEEPIAPDQATKVLGHPYKWCRCSSTVQREQQEYYDLMIDDETGRGLDRMHGWHHPGCGITQTG